MEFRYEISDGSLSERGILNVSETEFNELANARYAVLEYVSLEEKFDMVLENYKELESGLLNMSVEAACFPDMSYITSMERRRFVARKVSNFMSSCRLFIDHARRHMGRIAADEDERNALHGLFSTAYDRSFSYRIMEALRNHVQHAGLPISCDLYWHRYKKTSEDLMVNIVDVALQKNEVRGDKSFKAGVLDELDKTVKKNVVLLMTHIRQYLSELFRVVETVRVRFGDRMRAYKTQLINARERYAAQVRVGSSTVGMAFCKIGEPNNIILEYHGVPESLLAYFDSLIEKNKDLVRMEQVIIASQRLDS